MEGFAVLEMLLRILLQTFAFTVATPPHSRGVAFRHLGQLAYITSFHTVVVEVPFEPVWKEIALLEQEAERLAHPAGTPGNTSSSRIEGQLQQLRSSLKLLKTLTTDLARTEKPLPSIPVSSSKYFPQQQRHRRGLVNGIGEVVSYLFGVATEADLSQINSQVGPITAKQGELVSSVNQHTTIIKKMSLQMESLQTSISSFGTLLRTVSTTLEEHVVVQDLLILQQQCLQLFSHVNSIDVGIRRMNEGKVAPEIVHMQSLRAIASALEASGYTPFFGSDDTTILEGISSVVTLRSPSAHSLRYGILIPLQDFSFTFHLFKVNPIPMWEKSLNLGVVYAPVHQYLAVSADLGTFSPLSSLDVCHNQGDNWLCPAGFPIFTKDSQICEVQLYLGLQNLVRTCPRQVFSSLAPSFSRINDGYLYSAPTPINITIQCPGNPPSRRVAHLFGSGTLMLSPGCHAAGRGLLLIAPNTSPVLDTHVLIRPDQTFNFSLITPEEHSELQEQQEVIKEELQSQVERSLEVNLLLKKVKQVKEARFSSKWESVSRPASIAVTIIVVLLFCIVMRLVCVYRGALLGCCCGVATRIARRTYHRRTISLEGPEADSDEMPRSGLLTDRGASATERHPMTLRPKIRP